MSSLFQRDWTDCPRASSPYAQSTFVSRSGRSDPPQPRQYRGEDNRRYSAEIGTTGELPDLGYAHGRPEPPGIVVAEVPRGVPKIDVVAGVGLRGSRSGWLGLKSRRGTARSWPPNGIFSATGSLNLDRSPSHVQSPSRRPMRTRSLARTSRVSGPAPIAMVRTAIAPTPATTGGPASWSPTESSLRCARIRARHR
jgi:hypothetical protein